MSENYIYISLSSYRAFICLRLNTFDYNAITSTSCLGCKVRFGVVERFIIIIQGWFSIGTSVPPVVLYKYRSHLQRHRADD